MHLEWFPSTQHVRQAVEELDTAVPVKDGWVEALAPPVQLIDPFCPEFGDEEERKKDLEQRIAPSWVPTTTPAIHKRSRMTMLEP